MALTGARAVMPSTCTVTSPPADGAHVAQRQEQVDSPAAVAAEPRHTSPIAAYSPRA